MKKIFKVMSMIMLAACSILALTACNDEKPTEDKVSVCWYYGSKLLKEEEVAKDEVSVIITKTPCVLLDKSKKPVYVAHSDKCKKCGMCMKPGCPAMTKNADGTIRIDDTMCTGCGLCETLCKFDAIELVKAGDK